MKKYTIKVFASSLISLMAFSSLKGGPKDADYLIYKEYRVSQNENQTIQVSKLDGNHVVGLKCKKEAWDFFNSHRSDFQVELTTKNQSIQIVTTPQEEKGTWCDYVDNCYYIFTIAGRGDASIRIHLPRIPLQATTKILIFKSPQQTERP